MELSNSIYFEHNSEQMSATVKEDITTDPKILLITPNETEDLGADLKFELIGGEWVGPEELREKFSETYASILNGINKANYIL